ncbi:hypothetical protein SY83_02105 [Paenibacillus swuensis]|uniref:Potassium channel domain-containing protein n=1 Tax=Paenibacillus swuensis TaxID=1178515 RepID=A0A172TEE2_9BACL|nr:hypothetical protein SY83_02105 [Paenibacillus swuensis]
MIRKINLWSFLLMFVCWVLFFFSVSEFFLPFNQHYLVLGFTIIVFMFSVIGLGDVTNGKKALRSTLTIAGTLTLIFVEAGVLVLANIFKFT